jgi:single-stranded-DNA-specific exonuclease
VTIAKKQWNVFAKQHNFLNQFPVEQRLTAQILYNRDITTVEMVEDFLTNSSDDNDPFLLKDMDKAVTRLTQALDRQESIVVYGDYDVDGITSTVLMVQYLQSLGARVKHYIPNRFHEGYGLNNQAIKTLADEGITLIVTVDCGIRSVGEAKYAAALGLDMIITDHHGPGDEIPPARAVINPKQPDCPYPFRQLAGVGLALKLAQAIHQKIQPAVDAVAPDAFLDLVALGTVADLATLIGENRKLVKLGLARLNQNLRPGLAALLAETGGCDKTITAETIGFGLGPRLNAAGRLESAQTAFELLMAADEEQARPLAKKLHELNRERQQKTRDIIDLARQEILADGTEQLLYLISHPNFESGVVGLAASRLAEEFYRPVLVAQHKEDGTAVGSARSIDEFHITRALDQCETLLVKHGGHSAAAGFTVTHDNLPRLRAHLQQIAADTLNPANLYPTINIDAEFDVDKLHRITNDKYMAELERLEPFGMGNARPLFVTRNLTVKEKRAIGQDGSHLRLVLKNGAHTWQAIGFSLGHWADKLNIGQPVDIVYSLQYNEWNNTRTLQLEIKDLRVQPAIIVHGGAWRIPAEEHEAHKNGCRGAAQAGFDILTGGGTALDAVEAAVTLLEDDPTFDAGIGSHLSQTGAVQLDAGMMDGDTLQVGAVAAVERVKNPIQLTRRLLDSEHNMFVGAGAEEWAEKVGHPLTDPAHLIVPREQERFEHHRQAGPPSIDTAFQQPDGTVGAVAIDRWGNLAAATSTGGTLFKPAGRVGDSPLPGCGYFADNQSAAVSSTGHGESIIRVQLARTAADHTRTQGAMAAAEAAIDILASRVNGLGGLIMIDRAGRIGFAHNTPNLARAWMTVGMTEPEAGI